jgi:serine/threonine protein phosphatase 1
MLTYAIGDIHGCHDSLRRLLDRIRQHAGGRLYRLVFLGDYIDRGPDSAAVIETVRRRQMEAPGEVVCLMGNHEAMLLMAVADPAALGWWIGNGGDTTLMSFGARTPRAIPRDVLEWFSALPTSYEDGQRYYVHAGFNPGKTREEQTDEEKTWIREPFLSIDHDFGKHVVHGHTPLRSGRPDVRPYRTNLDTAAVFGGVLTAGIFTDEQGPAIGFLNSSPSDRGMLR